MARGKIHTINLAVYPQVLTVAPGDTIRVITEFDYVGPAQKDATVICAIFHPTFFDRHDEIVRREKAVPIPNSPLPGNHFTVTIDLPVPSGEIGTDYGLYSSIRHVTGPDIYCEDPKWLENIITPPPVEYTLDVTVEPPGAGHVLISPKGPYSPGTVVTLVATPYSGYEFDHWGGAASGTSPTTTIIMSKNQGVVAYFKEVAPPPVQYTLDVAVEPPATGYVTKSPSKAKYSAGEVVTLTAHPHSGYEFDHWGGWPPYPGIQSTSSTLKLTMTADWWVVAAFRKIVTEQYTLAWSVRPLGSGTISPASGTKYPSGTTVTLRATPYSGYEFDHWSGAASGTSPTTTIIMDRTKWVEASFREVAVVTTVTVTPKNPPSRAEQWQLIISDWNKAQIESKFYIPITAPATFEIPPGTIFPLRVDIIMFHNTTIDYRMQSLGTVFPFPPEWYVEAFIPEYGNYYYNVSTERFEKV